MFPMPPQYDTSMIEVLSGREAVRKRPAMWIRSGDGQDTDNLILHTIDGLLWHHRHLEQTLQRIGVGLGDDGSVVVVSYCHERAAVHTQESVQLLRRELQELHGEYPVGLFVVNALSARLTADVRVTDDLWHRFTFEQGILRHEESHAHKAEPGAAINLAVWPDFTILESGPVE
jgi:DNA gyrase subunit B